MPKVPGKAGQVPLVEVFKCIEKVKRKKCKNRLKKLQKKKYTDCGGENRIQDLQSDDRIYRHGNSLRTTGGVVG